MGQGTDGSSGTETRDAARSDATGPTGIDEGRLYAVIRAAVEDAILGAVGTVLLVGIGLLVVWVGVMLMAQSTGSAGLALGIVAVLFGFYVAAASVGVVPSIWDVV